MRPAHLKERQQKEVRQIRKEQHEIYRKIRALPYIEVDKPIRHGWYKEIVLTENLDRYKHKVYILEIFKIIETYYWGRTKEECDKHWDKQRSKHFIFREVPTISKKQYNRLSEKAKKICTPFQYRDDKKLRIRFYIRFPKNTYKIKYARAYITHFQVHDAELHSRIAKLDNRLLHQGMYELNAYNYKDFWDIPDSKKNRKKTKQLYAQYRNASTRSAIEELWERN